MALTVNEMGDVIVSSLADFGMRTWTSLVHDLQKFIALPQVFREGIVRQRGGTQIEFRATTDHNASARMVGLFAEDVVHRTDMVIKGTVPWRHITWDYAYDLHEISIQQGGHEIIDIVKVVRNSSWDSAAILLEKQLWTEITSTTDETSLYGIPLWIQKSTTQGFNGKNPTAFSSGIGSIDSTVQTRWANWTDQYTGKTRGDLIEKMKLAAYKTNFTAPVPFPERKRGSADSLGIYSTYDTSSTTDLVAEQQNENLGQGLASMRATFMGRAFTPVPFLDQSSTWDTNGSDPVWMVNWQHMIPYVLIGWHMKEDKPRRAPNQNNVVVVHVDFTTNLVCDNRRAQALLVGPNG